jgi:type II secretory pathway component PulF
MLEIAMLLRKGMSIVRLLELVQSIQAREERLFELLQELEAMLSEGNNGQA